MVALIQELWNTRRPLTGLAIVLVTAWPVVLLFFAITGTTLFWLAAIAAAVYIAATMTNNWIVRGLITIVTAIVVVLITLVPAQGFVSLLALLPVVALVVCLVAIRDPVIFGIITVSPEGQRFSRWVATIIASELFVGIFLVLVPVGRNLGAIPLLILAVATLLLVGFAAGTVRGARAARLATTFLIILIAATILSFFLPRASQAIGNTVGGVDSALASVLNGNVQLPTAQAAPVQQPAAPRPTAAPYQRPPTPIVPPISNVQQPAVRWIERTVEVGPGWTTFNIPIPDQFIVNIYSGYGGCFNIRYPEGGYWGDGTTVPTGYTVTCPNSQDRIPGASVIELGANRNVRIQLKYAYRP